MLAGNIDPEKFALAVVASSSPKLDVENKWNLYEEAFKFAEKKKVKVPSPMPELKSRK